MNRSAPLVVFIYNRPEHTARALNSLATSSLAKDTDLIAYADGAKHDGHRDVVRQARNAVRQAKGFRSINIVERDKNFGLARSVISGVTEVCAAHGRAIVVEDDLVVSPQFLAFMNAGLDRYAEDARVLQVSGYSYPVDGTGLPATYFLPMISCWGWGIWQRAWAKFDPAMTKLSEIDGDASARSRFNIDDAYDYYGMACDQRAGKIDSWGVRWQLSLFANDGLVLYPRNSLVYNSGTDASGTHGAGHAAFQNAGTVHASQDVEVWPVPAVGGTALERVKHLLAANRPNFVRRLIQRIRR